MHAYSYSGDRIKAFGLMAFLAVVLAIAINAVATWLGLGPPWLVSAPTVAAVFGILYGIVDKWAWRWKVLQAVGVITTPDVSGKYKGMLRSSYHNTERQIEVDIEQSWTRIVVRFFVLTGESSESISLAAALQEVGHRHARLTYMYRNTVRPGYADPDMNDHDGTAELTVNLDAQQADGRYYNFRGRQGALQLSSR